MAEAGILSGTMRVQGQSVKIKLSIVRFEDNGCKVLYCPAVNVYGYGRTDREARESLAICMEEFFSYAIEQGTIFEELHQLGWRMKQQQIAPPTFATLLSKNKALNAIVNNRQFMKVDRNFKIPAFA